MIQDDLCSERIVLKSKSTLSTFTRCNSSTITKNCRCYCDVTCDVSTLITYSDDSTKLIITSLEKVYGSRIESYSYFDKHCLLE